MDTPLILGRYRLIERLASGGSAEVWRARDEQLQRPVAVKRLHPHLLPDETSRKRLAAEARAAAGLSHPAIVSVYDVDAEGDAPVIVMELVDGESLGARIARSGPLGEHEAAAVAAEIADALFHAHQRGVVHRDVKPGNVLLGTDGRARLVDFGIAHSLAASAERLTVTGTVIGTLSAMAPEQLAGGPITPRTDLYGIGVVLHEALTGRPPYPASSPLVLADAQRSGPPPLAGVDAGLAGIVAACLAVEPENRPLHAGQLAAALRGWMAGDADAASVPSRAYSGGWATGAITQPAPLVDQPTDGRLSETRYRRDRRPIFTGVLATVLAAIVVIAAISVIGDTAVVEPTPSPSLTQALTDPPAPVPTAAPTPTPTPAVVMPAWAAKLAEEYAEECGTALDPALIAGMTRKQAEEALEPEIEACEEARED